MSSEDIVNTHNTFMKSLGIELSDDDKRLPYLHWTHKLDESQAVKYHFSAGSSKCTTKQLSSLLTKILTVIKTVPEKYCSIKTSHTGVNIMWTLKHSAKGVASKFLWPTEFPSGPETTCNRLQWLFWHCSSIESFQADHEIISHLKNSSTQTLMIQFND